MSFAPIQCTVPLHACETVSGRYVDIVNPKPGDIHLFDWKHTREQYLARYNVLARDLGINGFIYHQT